MSADSYCIKRMELPTVSGRQCGSCTACCTTHAVYDLRKPGNVTCQHSTGTGCAIYETRPSECRDFDCGWLSGWIEGEQRRPDKLGLVFHFQPLPEAMIIAATEVWPGASEPNTPGRYYLDKLSKKIAVRLYRIDGKTFLLPGWEEIYTVPQEKYWDTPLWDKWLSGDPTFFDDFRAQYVPELN